MKAVTSLGRDRRELRELRVVVEQEMEHEVVEEEVEEVVVEEVEERFMGSKRPKA